MSSHACCDLLSIACGLWVVVILIVSVNFNDVGINNHANKDFIVVAFHLVFKTF